MSVRVALITGAAKRIGAACVRQFHSAGFNVVVHYHRSDLEARHLADSLNQQRADSIRLLKADLARHGEIVQMAEAAMQAWGRLDVLINNASQFTETPFGEISEAAWEAAMAANLKAPFFLAQTLAPALSQTGGSIVNIADIHGERGLPGYLPYSVAKAGLLAMTKMLAKELAPQVRVNAVSPGAILWPVDEADAEKQAEILKKVPMQRCGSVEDIARTVQFLACDALYVTGQNLAVDGGRLLFS